MMLFLQLGLESSRTAKSDLTSAMNILSFARFSRSRCCVISMMFLSWLALSSRRSDAQASEEPTVIQRFDPPQFGFYAKAIDCGGVFIRGSAAVQDAALEAACSRMTTMMAQIDVTQRNLRQRGVELHVFGREQGLADLPENRRSLAGVVTPIPADPGRGTIAIYSACGEESLTSPSTGYDLCMREFAVALMDYGFDDEIRRLIAKQYQVSITAGRWRGTPAAVGPESFWAELSMRYFGARPNFIRETPSIAPGPEGLRQYDAAAFALLDLLYSGKKRPAAIEAIRAREVSKLALSHVSNRPAELQLVNNSGQRIRIFWIDTQGESRSLGELGPYNRMIEKTYFNHVWMIEDERGVELQRFVIEDYVSEVIAID
jgi:VHL beta domain